MRPETKTFILTQLSARKMEVMDDLSFWSKEGDTAQIQRCVFLINKLDEAMEELFK